MEDQVLSVMDKNYTPNYSMVCLVANQTL